MLVLGDHLLVEDGERVHLAHHLAQAVDVELLPGDLLAERDQLAQLSLDVGAVALERLAVRRIVSAGAAPAGEVEHEHRAAVHPLPDLRPLDVRVAGVRRDDERRLGELPVRMVAAGHVQARVHLHVAADVRRVAVVLGRRQELHRLAPHRGLERGDLREAHRDVERAQDLGDRAHHEHVGDRLPLLLGRRHLLPPALHQPAALGPGRADQVGVGSRPVLRLLRELLDVRHPSPSLRRTRRAGTRRRSRPPSASARTRSSSPRTP